VIVAAAMVVKTVSKRHLCYKPRDHEQHLALPYQLRQ
jgi:hypothetical protein